MIFKSPEKLRQIVILNIIILNVKIKYYIVYYYIILNVKILGNAHKWNLQGQAVFNNILYL